MTPDAERKRKSRAEQRALADAGLMKLREVVVPVGLGDYLRRRRLLDHTAEDEPNPIARGAERLLALIVAESQ